MARRFLVARNPESDSSLPWLGAALAEAIATAEVWGDESP
jgi:hypothetical protein